GSSDDGHHPKPSQQLTEEIQKFLAQSQRWVKKKRAGTKHKKSHKKRKRIRSGGSAVKSTVRGLRATRKKRLRKKTKRQGWALSRRARNRRAHALNGNGFSFGSKATLVLAAFLAPVVRRVQLEMEEIVETGSEAFQVVIAEGGEELASFIETVFSTARFAIVGLVFWWVSRKVANVMMHMAHGNATPRLVQFDGNVSTWEVKGGTRGVHRVRIAGRAPGCACREFLRTGTCDHVEVALAAHKKLVGPQGAEASLVEKAKGLRSEAQPGSSGDQGQQLREPEESQTPEFAVRKERENKPRLALEDVSPWTGVALSRGGRGSQDQELNVQLLINKESQEAILSALQTLKGGEVIATAYTLDQPDLVEGLLALGGSARLVVDKGQSHGTRTKLQFQSLQQLVRGGVRVIGKGQRGIQHSKTFAISKDGQFQLIIGSCNWTTASRSNAEAGVLLTGSCGHEVYQQYTENFERLWKEAVVFDGTRVAEDEPRRRVFGKQSVPTEED
ncbi:Pro-Pol polyprotein, partial [Durusdinium trenchii]